MPFPPPRRTHPSIGISPDLENLELRSELRTILRRSLHVSYRHLNANPRKQRNLRIALLIVNFQVRVAEFKAKLDREQRESSNWRFHEFAQRDRGLITRERPYWMRRDESSAKTGVGSSAIGNNDCDSGFAACYRRAIYRLNGCPERNAEED